MLAGYWQYHLRTRPREVAYAGERRVILWSSTAQVRQPMMTLPFGEKVGVLGHYGDKLKVRTAHGVVGWIDASQLLSPEVWGRVGELAHRADAMPLQARGHTRVAANLRLEPGRDGEKIIQLTRDVPVEVLARAVVEEPRSEEEETTAAESSQGHGEDWWLVRARVPDVGVVSGWVLGRFIQMNLPDPLPDYASAAGMRILAWFALNRVADPRAGPKPQFLVAGAAGPEGQPCDFTMLRVFTWSVKRQRYETAYIASNLCGQLPVKVTPATQLGGDAYFHFVARGRAGDQELDYRLHQTIVRRIRKSKELAAPPRQR